ncbi:hypothetical protein P3T32_005198 [Ralstonia sp. GP73]|jgi:Protein of unknown function (DUF3800)|uniref:DUF3800 domain-containing protein n=1 Tax=Ralstonia thomasii TaxID=3058596 RepID=A0ABM9JYG0_9RALS|nr:MULTISPECIES: DUF3800 domain-containing protein [unclassified Ralstonia]MDH6645318.1 hypothetical protein [Ralstonia sp. GP73]CAJ0807722.1 hypothetical protein LMG18095_04637 [Ralstonia sp. LMG 18095]
MSTIYCDEAGNSGERLIDAEQPHFVLVSNDFGKEEATSLLSHVQSPQGAEPKFKTLRKSSDGVNRLIRFLSDPRLDNSRLVIHCFDKRFMVVTKMVDLIIETLQHEMGRDLYQGGTNLAMSNMMHFCLPEFCGKAVTEKLLEAFVNLMRTRTDESVHAYYFAAREAREASVDNDFKNFLAPFADHELFHTWFDGIGPSVLEPAIPALFSQLGVWSARKSDRFRVVHDKSKPILATQNQFEQMMATSGEPSLLVGYDRRKFHFPLRATSLEQGDSKEYPQIQVSDLCVGAVARFMKYKDSGVSDPLNDAFVELVGHHWEFDGVMPSTAVTPKDLKTDSADAGNPIDAILHYLERRSRK